MFIVYCTRGLLSIAHAMQVTPMSIRTLTILASLVSTQGWDAAMAFGVKVGLVGFISTSLNNDK